MVRASRDVLRLGLRVDSLVVDCVVLVLLSRQETIIVVVIEMMVVVVILGICVGVVVVGAATGRILLIRALAASVLSYNLLLLDYLA